MKIPRITAILAAIIFLYSTAVIIGYVFGVGGITKALPAAVDIKFPTALCFWLSAISLYFMANAVLGKREISEIAIPAISLIIGLIMATFLAAGIFGGQSGLESLFANNLFVIQPSMSDVPALPTMINFVLFCLASILTLLGTLKVKKYLLGIGFYISLVGVVAVFGYIFRLPFLYFQFNTSFVAMAPNTAVLFLLVGIGVMECSFQIKKAVQ